MYVFGFLYLWCLYINAVYIDVRLWISLSLVPIYKRCIYRCESLCFFIFCAYIKAVYIDVSFWISLSLVHINAVNIDVSLWLSLSSLMPI